MNNFNKKDLVWYLDSFHREIIIEAIKNKITDNDIFILSDIDEIPKLDNFDFTKIRNKVHIFEQKYFYYKLNLFDPTIAWHGSRVCKFSRLLSPQWIRNIKAKKYSFWRLDLLFSNNKYFNISIERNDGWHFSYFSDINNIIYKIESFAHTEYNEDEYKSLETIKHRIENGIDPFDRFPLKYYWVDHSYPECIQPDYQG